MVFYRTAPPEWEDESSGLEGIPCRFSYNPVSSIREDSVDLHAWKTYVQLQECSRDGHIPSLEITIFGYVRNRWTINRAWVDFRNIVREHSVDIAREAGEFALWIEGFRIDGLTYWIFRRMFIDMALHFEMGVAETVTLTKGAVRKSLDSDSDGIFPVPLPNEFSDTLSPPSSF